MSPVAIVLIGIIGILSISWQFSVLDNLSDTKKLAFEAVYVPPIVVGAIVIVGVLLYSIFMYIDDSAHNIGLFGIIKNVFFAMVFTMILLIKNIFGPAVNGWILSYGVYYYFAHGSFEIWPFMNWIISLVIDSVGQNGTIAYTILFMLVSVICSGIAAITNS